MIAIPAVDLRDGACVQLVGGEYAQERVRLADPVAVARGWAEQGFQQLHVVDLDAATGRGSNASVIRAILDLDLLDVQVGGGVREARDIERLLDDGATRVVVGTRALEETGWLAEMAAEFPGQLVVAADVRERRVVTRGQMQGTDLPLMEDVAELSRVPVYASGGVSTVHDLRALADRGVYAAVIGMALYTGALDARGVAEEFAG